MIRSTKHSLKHITAKKRKMLDEIFDEYTRLVNAFIDILWEMDSVPRFADKKIYNLVSSSYKAGLKQEAAQKAIKIVKSAIRINQKKIYRVYKSAYKKCKKTNRNICGILDKRWSEWKQGKTFRRRATKPVFRGTTIELSSKCCIIHSSNNIKTFDLLVQLRCIFPVRTKLYLPIKKHRHYNSLVEQHYQLKKHIVIIKQNNQYYLKLCLEKPTPAPPSVKTNKIGIDLGLKKLMSCSNGQLIGKQFENLLKKLQRKQTGSKAYYRCLDEVKNYIGFCCNQLDWDKLDLIAIENLKYIKKGIRNRLGKETRFKVQYWNLGLVIRRLLDKCESNRVELVFVESEYTSQACSACFTIDKRSRKQQVYKCKHCGHIDDADVNAAKNILARYLGQQFDVADTKELI